MPKKKILQKNKKGVLICFICLKLIKNQKQIEVYLYNQNKIEMRKQKTLKSVIAFFKNSKGSCPNFYSLSEMYKMVTFIIFCKTEVIMVEPPGVPNTIFNLPSFSTIVGVMELSIRFSDAIELASEPIKP